MSDQKLKNAFGAAFDKKLSEDGMSVANAAKLIGKSRQIVHRYINGQAYPRPKTLVRIAQHWDFPIEVEGYTVSSTSLAAPAIPTGPLLPPVQMSFLDKLEQHLTSDRLRINVVGRIGNAFKLEVEIVA